MKTYRHLWTSIALALAIVSPAGSQQAPGGAKTLTFDGDAIGSPPGGFEFARTGRGAEGKWVVRADASKPANHVLVQESADPTDYRLPLAVVKEGSYGDVTLSVRARPVSGASTRASDWSGAIGTRTTTTSPAATPTRTTARSTTS